MAPMRAARLGAGSALGIAFARVSLVKAVEEQPMRARTAVMVLLALFMLPPAGPGTQAAELQKLKITVPTISTIFSPLYYGQDKAISAKEGLDIEVISTNGDGPDVDAVISGSAQFAISTPNRLFTAYEQGKPLKAVGMLARRMSIDCAMNKEV